MALGSVERLLELIPVNTPREGVVTPLGRYFDCMASRANTPITVALVHDYDMVRLGVAFCSTSTATVLFSPSSTRRISELVMR